MTATAGCAAGAVLKIVDGLPMCVSEPIQQGCPHSVVAAVLCFFFVGCLVGVVLSYKEKL